MSLHICRTCIQSIVLLPEATAMCRILSDKCSTSIRNDCSQNKYPDRQSNSIRNTNIKGTLEMNYQRTCKIISSIPGTRHELFIYEASILNYTLNIGVIINIVVNHFTTYNLLLTSKYKLGDL